MSILLTQILGNLLIVWAMVLITYATIVTFVNFLQADVSMSWATIQGSTVGILATVTGYVQKRLSDMVEYEKRSRFTD